MIMKMDRIITHISAGGHPSEILPQSNDLQEHAAIMKELGEELERIGNVKSALQKAWDYMRLTKIPEIMDEMGASSVNLSGIGRVTLASDAYVTVPAEAREQLHSWLIDNGYSDLITETVNSSTLKAWVVRRVKSGEAIPPVVKVTPFTRAAITPKA